MESLRGGCEGQREPACSGPPLTHLNVIQVLQENAFAAGALSAACTTVVLQPFDLVKTRLQNLTTTCGKTGRMITIVIDVVRTESVSGLWKGSIPSLMRNVPGIGLYFCSIDFLSKKICGESPVSPVAAVGVGMTARTFSGLVLLPMTLLKTKFESGLFRYRGAWHALSHTHAQDGLIGLFRGSSATLLRDVPYSGVYLLFYSQMKQRLSQNSGEPSVKFACGLSAGVLASLVTHPFDVVKTKMQLSDRKDGGFIRTSTSIFRTHGIMSFGSGMTPRIMRRSLMSALSWTIFESLSHK